MASPKGSRLLSFFPKISRRKNQVLIIDTPSTIVPDLDTQETQLECKGASKFSQAPQDVLFLIADHLDKATQASLIRTCRYFHHTLEVNLYLHIAPTLPWSYYSNDSLFRTLMERQDLLLKIRTYHGPFMQAIVGSLPKRRFQDRSNPGGRLSSANFDALPINETAGFKRVVTIFEKATNIVDLNFTDGSTWTSDPPFEPIRTAVSKMSLRKLTLWRCNGLVQVLRDQPGLEELCLGWNSPEIEQLEETDVPKLKALAATPQEAALLVPGRPIERLNLIPTGSGLQDFDEQLFNKFLLSTTHITTLSVHLHLTRRGEEVRAAIRVITQTLPGVEKLTITVKGPISGRIILDEIPSLQSIRCLTFLGARLVTAADLASSVANDSTQAEDEGDSIPQAPAVENWDDLFAQLRKLCPLLVNISYTT